MLSAFVLGVRYFFLSPRLHLATVLKDSHARCVSVQRRERSTSGIILMLVFIENVGRRMTEYAIRQQEAYVPLRPFDQIVEEAWDRPILRREGKKV